MAASTQACSSDNNNSAPLVATSISVVSTDTGQIGTVGTALALPITVSVTDQDGNPIANATVTWAVTSGLGSVSATTSQTGSTGQATVAWTLGNLAGIDSLQATLASGATVKVGATAIAGPVAALVKVGGDGQTVASGTTSLPFVVAATDMFGNPVVNATVAWAVQGGGSLSASSTTTGANGQSQVSLTLASTPTTYTITAMVGTQLVTFTLTGD
jgi:adhesin/invasin